MGSSLSTNEFFKRLEQQTLIDKDFIEGAFQYWLEDSADRRCPFPEDMCDELRTRTFRQFMEWTFELDDPDAASAEELSEKFGEIIQAVGLSLARTPDERLTIQYPDLPRVGDKVNLRDSESKMRAGEIVQRSLVEDAGKKELRVRVRFSDTAEEWETGFALSE